MSPYRYRITVEALPSPLQTTGESNPAFSFESSTYDDLFRIVEVVHQRQLVEDDAATGLAVGLKLFEEIVIRHRKDPLFLPSEARLRQFIGC